MLKIGQKSDKDVNTLEGGQGGSELRTVEEIGKGGVKKQEKEVTSFIGYLSLIIKTDASKRILNSFCHCAFIINFLANFYFIFQIYPSKSFKM